MSGEKESWGWKGFSFAVSLAAAVCLIQVGWALLIGCLIFPGQKPQEVYFKLNQWDSIHYADIMNRGYQIPPGLISPQDVHTNRANVAFFPGYPLLAKGVQRATGVSTEFALLLTSQFACFFFWIQLFLLALSWGRPKMDCLRMAVLISLFPSSFFLIAGYSESLFLSALVGIILWTQVWMDRKSKTAFLLSALSGFVLTATRFVGIPLVSLPLLLGLGRIRSSNGPRVISLLALPVLSSIGVLSFFLWCSIRFGKWDLYIQLQQLGWGNQPKYWAIFDPWSYIPKFFLEDTVNSFSKFSNAFIVMYAASLIYRWGFRSFERSFEKLAYFFGAFSLFFISVSGKANYNMDSIIRYNLPVFILLLLYQARFGDFSQKGWKKVISLILIVVQGWMTLLFLKGGWVA